MFLDTSYSWLRDAFSKHTNPPGSDIIKCLVLVVQDAATTSSGIVHVGSGGARALWPSCGRWHVVRGTSPVLPVNATIFSQDSTEYTNTLSHTVHCSCNYDCVVLSSCAAERNLHPKRTVEPREILLAKLQGFFACKHRLKRAPTIQRHVDSAIASACVWPSRHNYYALFPSSPTGQTVSYWQWNCLDLIKWPRLEPASGLVCAW